MNIKRAKKQIRVVYGNFCEILLLFCDSFYVRLSKKDILKSWKIEKLKKRRKLEQGNWKRKSAEENLREKKSNVEGWELNPVQKVSFLYYRVLFASFILAF